MIPIPTRGHLAAAFLAVAVVLTSSRCSSTQTRYLHPNADLAAIQRVAVMPFDTLAQDETSAEKVQKVFYLELLALEVFDVVEPGQVRKSVRAKPEELSTEDFQRIGKELGADALFLGTVVDFAESRDGGTPAPEVALQLRLVETATGATVWSTGESRSGASMSTRLFGIGGNSLTEAARELIRSQLATLLR